ncbi:hypothetical protein [Xenorhabdus innexi]|uniref:Uncharacterized protein n=1 Tax=Xenorhabdus innexi TaxID=290109 RepID=A0A1N6N0M3_9GAMM|nr:hypothetical protein [Xenorhabdus innexi]PHM27686.1 hypothetical protein Xinn_03940 [Xenorhabdus innexi]SIP74646.1 hypothetical protein XIS1_720009 [Xenorhabdus innexi]
MPSNFNNPNRYNDIESGLRHRKPSHLQPSTSQIPDTGLQLIRRSTSLPVVAEPHKFQPLTVTVAAAGCALTVLDPSKMKLVKPDELMTTMNTFHMNIRNEDDWKRAISLLIEINVQLNDCDLENLPNEITDRYKNAGFFSVNGILKYINEGLGGSIGHILGMVGTVLWEQSQIEQTDLNKLNNSNQTSINGRDKVEIQDRQNNFILAARAVSISDACFAFVFGLIIKNVLASIINRRGSITENNSRFVAEWVKKILIERYMKDKKIELSGNVSMRSIPKLAFFANAEDHFRVYVPDKEGYINPIINAYCKRLEERSIFHKLFY